MKVTCTKELNNYTTDSKLVFLRLRYLIALNGFRFPQSADNPGEGWLAEEITGTEMSLICSSCSQPLQNKPCGEPLCGVDLCPASTCIWSSEWPSQNEQWYWHYKYFISKSGLLNNIKKNKFPTKKEPLNSFYYENKIRIWFWFKQEMKNQEKKNKWE